MNTKSLALNACASALTYADYKLMFNYINGEKTVADLHEIATGIIFDKLIEENYRAGIVLMNFFEDEIVRLSHSSCAYAWDTYDEEFPNNTYYWGFQISDKIFVTNYSGVAGKHWDTICFDY